jgi:hypothetical protein
MSYGFPLTPGIISHFLHSHKRFSHRGQYIAQPQFEKVILGVTLIIITRFVHEHFNAY